MDITPEERDQWMLITGVILANKDIRAEIFSQIDTNFCPVALAHSLLVAVKSGERKSAQAALKRIGVPINDGENLINAIIKQLNHRIFRQKCISVAGLLTNRAHIDPDKFLPELKKSLGLLKEMADEEAERSPEGEKEVDGK